MAKDQVKLEIVNENNKDSDKYLDNEIARIFGKPPPVPNHPTSNGLLNNAGEKIELLNGNNNYGECDSERTRQPLLEPRLDRQLPPLAGPEIDDLDGDPPKDATPYPGIDDGLLEPSDKKPNIPDHDDDGEHDTEHDSGDEHHTFTTTNEGGNGTDGKLPWEHDVDEPDYPYGDWNTKPLSLSTNTLDHEVATVRSYASNTNGLGPRFGIDDRAVSPIPGVAPDVNTYQQKKNLAQGMMDLALLSANANQLRYVLESSTAHPYFYSSVIFISLSIIFQILVGVGLILNSRYDVNVHKDICKADKINNMTVIGIFLITIVNVFITSFSVATPAVVGGVPVVSPRSAMLMTNSSTSL